MNNYTNIFQREADGFGGTDTNWYPEYQAKCKELQAANDKIKELSTPLTLQEGVTGEYNIVSEIEKLYPTPNTEDTSLCIAQRCAYYKCWQRYGKNKKEEGEDIRKEVRNI